MPSGADEARFHIVRRQATSEVSSALRELAANLMRVTRGAGNAAEIAHQTRALFEACMRYREQIGIPPPPDEIADMLSVERSPGIMIHLSDQQIDRLDAEAQIISGALQIAASRLLDQKTHESKGHDEMLIGILAIVRARAEKVAARVELPASRRSRRSKS